MKKQFRISFLLLAGAAVLAAQAQNQAKATPEGNVENGKRLYNSIGCWQCHGTQAQGGGIFGPRLGPEAIPFIALKAYLRHPSGDMPPYTEKVASDQDLLDIWTFIKSVPKPPPVKSIPILNQ